MRIICIVEDFLFVANLAANADIRPGGGCSVVAGLMHGDTAAP